MLYLTAPDFPGCSKSGVQMPARLLHPEALSGREELRHLIIGSPQGVQSTINQLHVLNYAEQAQWSQLVKIPETGILITHQQGEVLSFLLRHRQLS